MNHAASRCSPDALPRRAVFLDKDGTLVDDVPYNVDPQLIRLTRNAGEGLRLLARAAFQLFVVSNQPGVALRLFREEALSGVRTRLAALMEGEGAPLSGFYYCPHPPLARHETYPSLCHCRKPAPGMLRRAAAEHGLSLARSWMIGDILDDIEAGRRAGCRTILIDNGNETEWRITRLRFPDFVATDLHEAARIVLAAENSPLEPAEQTA